METHTQNLGHSLPPSVNFTPDTNSSATIVVLGFLIIGILIGIMFFMYYKNQGNNISLGQNPSTKNEYHSLVLENKTDLVFTVILPSAQNIDVQPSKKISFVLGMGDIISATAYNYDSSIIKYSYKLVDPAVKELFIGNSGIFSNLSASDTVTFVNDGPYPVMFIEKSTAGGRRWVSDIILPQTQSSDHFVSKRSIWQVCHPTDENLPISELVIGGLPKKVVFNGKNLIAF